MKALRDFSVYQILKACDKYLLDVELRENDIKKSNEIRIHALMTRKWFPKLSRESAINHLISYGEYQFSSYEALQIKRLRNLCLSNVAVVKDTVTLDEEYISILIKYLL